MTLGALGTLSKRVITDDRLLFQRQAAGVALEPPGQFFDGYDPSLTAQMFNEFSTAGLRMGHTLIRETFTVADGPTGNDRLSEDPVDFFNPALLYNLNLGVNPYGGVFLGLVLERALDFDRYVFCHVL